MLPAAARARRNIGGRLMAWSYGKITSLALDPIEKKPLKFFFPGSKILSAGSFGCNFHCDFCQNWSISQQEAPYRQLAPNELAATAVQMKLQDNIGLAYTYNEPLVNFEFVLDCARLIRAASLKNVLVSNGFADPEPFAELLPWIDAMNIDLKSWGADFYKTICGGDVDTVKRNITAAAASCHVEVTTLLISGTERQRRRYCGLVRVAGIFGCFDTVAPDPPPPGLSAAGTRTDQPAPAGIPGRAGPPGT